MSEETESVNEVISRLHKHHGKVGHLRTMEDINEQAKKEGRQIREAADNEPAS